jgi:hypothetical protein
MDKPIYRITEEYAESMGMMAFYLYTLDNDGKPDHCIAVKPTFEECKKALDNHAEHKRIGSRTVYEQ